ncbi:MAG: plasmid partitioning protein RepB [Methylobacterium sp.]|jgi:ParB family chromosome partitioning protein|nr:plasmid partitioning protein RepB [Methylobacterium sp.]MCA3635604.1 plasmid partitioning protein RepB [Methylobacterium sp.]MCA3639613.1 plasmid partitioning protein RepB [Methylobacterium sp.]MCA3646725.1 plasmid partitioning protein RepB [Methylobacterium sp.]MCA3651002.1 plasmid partitioning protein RepB [Methylobacterium sp.]
MNKRTDHIRSLFARPVGGMLSADNVAADSTRVASGSVKAVKDALSGIERENEELRRQLIGQGAVVELDTALIDPSPVVDRFISENDVAYQALRQSIQTQGQEVPVLVRPHPDRTGRYQIAYGHRRVRAARELGVSVKATIRALTDEQLVVAQGLENSAREDLSFIERALFAARLEAGGYSRTVIQQALTIDRAEASKLIAVATAIPERVSEAIGKAPKIGRGRWLQFVEALKGEGASQRVAVQIKRAEFQKLPSDDRFSVLLEAALPKTVIEEGSTIRNREGEVVALVKETRRGISLTIDASQTGGFGAFLKARLPELFETFKAQGGQGS